MSTKILVIGGAGFIGSHLVQLFSEKKYEVWIFDNFSTGKREYCKNIPNSHVIKGDIIEKELLSEKIEKIRPEIVYHLAAIHHIPTCEEMPEQALRVNVEGTQSVLSACAKYSVPRIVFTSTGAIYDPAVTGPLSEDSPIKTLNVYSISKLTGEQLMSYYSLNHDSYAVAVRLFNTVGTRETNPHVIPEIMIQLIEGKRKIELGNIHPRRDYVHVKDVAEALYLLGTTSLKEKFAIFNIGSGKEYSVKELVELCSTIIDEPIEIISSPNRKRKIDRPNQLADITKINQVIGWKPKRTLKDALNEIWEEYKQKK